MNYEYTVLSENNYGVMRELARFPYAYFLKKL